MTSGGPDCFIPVASASNLLAKGGLAHLLAASSFLLSLYAFEAKTSKVVLIDVEKEQEEDSSPKPRDAKSGNLDLRELSPPRTPKLPSTSQWIAADQQTLNRLVHAAIFFPARGSPPA